MSSPRLSIGTLAGQANTTVPTIRYYEEIGLLPEAQRTDSGHRFYKSEDLLRLLFIKRSRDIGFPIEQVRKLVALLDDQERSCTEALALAKTHLDTVRSKLKEMRLLEKTLVGIVESCDAQCQQGKIGNCAIMEDLTAVDGMSSNRGCC